MVQSKKEGNIVYNVGCLGKISDYQESNDGRILINLTGLSRFRILKEITSKKLYREFQVEYKDFTIDVEEEESNINVFSLVEKAKVFSKKMVYFSTGKNLKN